MIAITSIDIVPFVVICFFLVVIGHELCHYIMWLPIATKFEWNFSQAYIQAQHPDTPFAHKWAAIAGVSPILLATAILSGLVVAGWDPTATPHHFIGTMAVILFGVAGGTSDFKRLAELIRGDAMASSDRD